MKFSCIENIEQTNFKFKHTVCSLEQTQNQTSGETNYEAIPSQFSSNISKENKTKYKLFLKFIFNFGSHSNHFNTFKRLTLGRGKGVSRGGVIPNIAEGSVMMLQKDLESRFLECRRLSVMADCFIWNNGGETRTDRLYDLIHAKKKFNKKSKLARQLKLIVYSTSEFCSSDIKFIRLSCESISA